MMQGFQPFHLPARIVAMTLIEELVDVRPGTPLALALGQRGEILRLSQASHDAVLIPNEPGGLSHGFRAELAARIARQNKQLPLAAHYEKRILSNGDLQSSQSDLDQQTR